MAPFDLIDDADAIFQRCLLASVIQGIKRTAFHGFLPGLMLRLTGVATAVAGRFEDVVFLRMQLDQRFQRFIEASQFAGLGTENTLLPCPS
jgi:hypothetical protein